MEYHHTQYGAVMIVGLLTATFGVCLASFVVQAFLIAFLVALPILIISLALFYSLSISVNADRLVCRFGIGVIRRELLLSDIQKARAVNNPWYVGWGIRWMPGRYWLWNVSGFLAVELTLGNGSTFRVGTDEPDALVRAIEAAKSLPPREPQ
jgi:hypothetical protein